MSDSGNPFNVQRVTEADLDPLFVFLMSYQWENSVAPLAGARVERMVEHLSNNTGGVAGIIKGPEGIEAAIGFELDKWWYSDDLGLHLRWLVTHPNFRRAGHARRLLNFLSWCRARMEATAKTPLPVYLYCADTPAMVPLARIFGDHGEKAMTIFLGAPMAVA